MNIKTILAAFMASALVFTGCRNEVESPVLSAETSMTVSADAHTESLSYTVEHAVDGENVTAESNVEWIHSFDCSKANVVTFEVDQNISEERTGVITLAYPSAAEVQVTVVQMEAGETISLEPAALSFLPSGGDLKVKVNSGKEWALVGSSDWVSASSEDGLPGEEVTFTAQPNTSDDPREASFTFICGTNRATLDITQSFEGRIIVEQSEYEVEGIAHEFTISLQSNMEDVQVEIEEGVDWLRRVETKAMQTMSFTFSVDENESETDRGAVVVFSNADASEQVRIVQVPSYPADVLTRVTDDTFKEYLKSFDTNGDGAVDRQEADAVTTISFDGSSADVPVSSFAGIEYFENLTTVELSGHEFVEEIDLSSNTKLESIDVSSSTRLASLNVEGCNAVKYITVGLCSALSSVDLTGMPELDNFIAYNSGLTSIDVSANTALTGLTINGTEISSVDLSKNTELVNLSLPALSSVDLSACTKLETLSATGAELTSLDLSHNTALTDISVSYSGITMLDHSMCPDLVDITYDYCSNLTTIDVSKNRRLNHISAMQCPALRTVIMYEGQQISDTWGISSDIIQYVPDEMPEDLLEGVSDTDLRKAILNEYDFNGNDMLDASEAANITYLDISSRPDITVLDGLDYLTELTELDAHDCGIESADLYFQRKLETVDLSGNKLTSIDFVNNQDITDLDVSGNQLKSVDNLPDALVTLDLSDNQLTSVDASNLMYIETVDLSNNQLTECDIHGSSSITSLDCSNNRLDQINIWSLSNLEHFDCSDNPLVLIGTYWENVQGMNYQHQLTYLVSLLTLDCSNTDVFELDLTECTKLQQLIATGCPELKNVYLAPGQTVADMQLDDTAVVGEKPAE